MPLLDKATTKAPPPTDFEIVGFVGCDGVGTTTHAERTIDFLEANGLNTEYGWIRFDHRLSIPVLALARVLGLTERHSNGSGHTVRAHRFEKSEFLSKLYTKTLIADQLRFAAGELRSVPESTDVYVADRFILDALVDLAVSTKDMSVLENDVADEFWGLIPENAVIIGLQCDPEVIARRRPDVSPDPFLRLRVEAYETIFEDERIDVVDTSQPIEEAHRQVGAILEDEHELA